MATISSRKADLGYRLYGVSAKARRPLLDWMIGALEAAGCRMLRVSEAREAPFRLTFETAMGERMGVLAYAFFANSEPTKNRPPDEHRFQIKYGKKTGGLHEIWSDPYALYTTLFFGINLEQGFFVGADPARHNPTRHFISLEYKEHQVQEILRRGWHAWQREKRESGRYGFDLPVEVLVGGRSEHFLRFIRFERAAQGLDAGHRELLAEEVARDPSLIEADVPAEEVPPDFPIAARQIPSPTRTPFAERFREVCSSRTPFPAFNTLKSRPA
ncbi:MAG: hypothetical protein IPJ17_05845 [Holophagales bacterium]|nr:MAG: hypothetical protein IPJ17_05845 [Holophagales bacterium]